MRRHCATPTGRTTAPATGSAPGRVVAPGAGTDVGAENELVDMALDVSDEAGAAPDAAEGANAHPASASSTALIPVAPTTRMRPGYAAPGAPTADLDVVGSPTR